MRIGPPKREADLTPYEKEIFNEMISAGISADTALGHLKSVLEAMDNLEIILYRP